MIYDNNTRQWHNTMTHGNGTLQWHVAMALTHGNDTLTDCKNLLIVPKAKLVSYGDRTFDILHLDCRTASAYISGTFRVLVHSKPAERRTYLDWHITRCKLYHMCILLLFLFDCAVTVTSYRVLFWLFLCFDFYWLHSL